MFIRYTASVQPTNNRAHILQAALNLFATRGYDAAGIQEIVDAAGISKPTLYHYFGSKRGLLTALLDETSTGLLADLRDAAAYHRNLSVPLERLTLVYLNFAAGNPTFFRLLLSLQFVT